MSLYQFKLNDITYLVIPSNNNIVLVLIYDENNVRQKTIQAPSFASQIKQNPIMSKMEPDRKKRRTSNVTKHQTVQGLLCALHPEKRSFTLERKGNNTTNIELIGSLPSGLIPNKHLMVKCSYYTLHGVNLCKQILIRRITSVKRYIQINSFRIKNCKCKGERDKIEAFHKVDALFCYVYTCSDFKYTPLTYLWGIKQLCAVAIRSFQRLNRLLQLYQSSNTGTTKFALFLPHAMQYELKSKNTMSVSTLNHDNFSSTDNNIPLHITSKVFCGMTVTQKHALWIFFQARMLMAFTGDTYVRITKHGVVTDHVCAESNPMCRIVKPQCNLNNLLRHQNTMWLAVLTHMGLPHQTASKLLSPDVFKCLSTVLLHRISEDIFTTKSLFKDTNALKAIISKDFGRTYQWSLQPNRVYERVSGGVFLVVTEQVLPNRAVLESMIRSQCDYNQLAPQVVFTHKPAVDEFWEDPQCIARVIWLCETSPSAPPPFAIFPLAEWVFVSSETKATWVQVLGSSSDARLKRRSITGSDTSPAASYVWNSECPPQPHSNARINRDEHQVIAMNNICRLPFSVLFGPGGTGKSEIISCLPLGTHLVLVHTCNARENLNNRLQSSGSGSVFQVKTVANWITRVNNSSSLKVQQQMRKEIGAFNTVVFEEFTMVPPEDFVALLSKFRQYNSLIRVLCVGDADQLPHMGPGCILREIQATFPNCCFELKKVFRQESAVGCLMAVLGQLRNKERLEFKPDDSFSIRSPGDLNTSLRKFFETHNTPKHLDDVQVIATTKALVCTVNRIAMSVLFGYNIWNGTKNNHFFIGQFVLTSSGHPVVSGGLQLEVVSIKHTKRRCDKTCENTLGLRASPSVVLALRERKRSSGTSHYEMTLQNAKRFLSPSYGMTVNKMQGCEVDRVVFLPSTTVRSSLHINFSSTLYTAVSRARKGVVVWIPDTWGHNEGFYYEYIQYNSLARRGFMTMLK